MFGKYNSAVRVAVWLYENFEYSASTFERSLNFVADLVSNERKNISEAIESVILFLSLFLCFLGTEMHFEYIRL